jgi:N-carbamoylputrescine amidase
VNRVGFEGTSSETGKAGNSGLEFWGHSFVCDPFGRVLAEGSADQEEILIVECDPKRVEETRRNWPFLRDRRIDAYSPILERWHE